MTTRDYIMQPRATRRTVPKVLNLSRCYGYQTLGYYCSLLAEARGHKVVPTVTTVLELTRRTSYVYALAELEDTLNRTIRRLADPPTASFRLLVCLGQVRRSALRPASGGSCSTGSAARSSRCSSRPASSWRVRKLAPVAITELGEAGKAQLGSGDRGACPPALEVAARQGAAAVHARRPVRPQGGAAALGPGHHPPLRAHRRGAWGWASR